MSAAFARADEALAELEAACAYLRTEWRYSGVNPNSAEYADWKARVFDVVMLAQTVETVNVQTTRDDAMSAALAKLTVRV